MSIEVNTLTKTYGDQNAIDGISFAAGKGEIIGLLGPNGAGKSTTMKILTCFMPPTSGTAYVCGEEIGKADLNIRKKIGYLPEHNPLYGSMYIKEYLMFVAQIHGLKNRYSRVADVIEKVGLTREQSKKISQLSKGYKQRVGIAQAIIHDPEVLILDEPISGLDPNQIVEIRNLISNLRKDKTIIFSSHILQEVESICDRVVILDKGKLVADRQLKASVSGEIKNIARSYITLELTQALADLNTIRSINGVQSIEKVNRADYKIFLETESDLRETIFDTVVGSGNKILGMNSGKQSLENVFKEVTND